MTSTFFAIKDSITEKLTPECLKAQAEELITYAESKSGYKRRGSTDEPCVRKDPNRITEWQAAWNVTNAIQGMFIVSLPYGVYHGGYWAIAAMIGIAHICCHTGKILVQCLYEPDPDTGEMVKVRHSYNEVAQHCLGKQLGGKIVNAAQLIELLMTCILYVVLCGDLLMGAFPRGYIDTRSYMMFCGILLLPVAFLKNLRHVSSLSLYNGVVHLIINAVIVCYCLINVGNWDWTVVRFKIDILSFPIALGVIVFSYTSQIFLPTLEENMIDKSKFECMLNWSHVAAAVFKSVFGYIGYLTFQEDTEQEVVNNLPSFLKTVVNLILVVKALLSYPLPYYAACELIEKELFQEKPTTKFSTIWLPSGDLKLWGLAFRVGVVIITIMFAAVIPHFTILMGFIGGFTGCFLSFIWPAFFHLKMHRRDMHWHTMVYDMTILFLGFIFGFLSMFYSGKAMKKAYEIGAPI